MAYLDIRLSKVQILPLLQEVEIYSTSYPIEASYFIRNKKKSFLDLLAKKTGCSEGDNGKKSLTSVLEVILKEVPFIWPCCFSNLTFEGFFCTLKNINEITEC